jgi:hypothetical protein
VREPREPREGREAREPREPRQHTPQFLQRSAAPPRATAPAHDDEFEEE